MLAETLIAPQDAAEYHSIRALSNSGMKDLAVSPLRYWHRWINPNRPADDPTAEMQLGSALHCAVLEPSEFHSRYACAVDEADYPGCLATIEDIRTRLRARGVAPKGTRKADVITQLLDVEPEAPILELIEQQHAKEHAGKVIFKPDDWRRINGMAEALRDEPRLRAILSEGQAEVSILSEDAEAGVPLKARLDWVTPKVILDLKTFSQKRGKSIDQSVADAIYYEAYYRQAYFYSLLKGWPSEWNGDFVLAFVESEEPHEVRIRSLRPKVGGNVNLYWERARVEVQKFIRTYAECSRHFGDKPWRYAQEITPLADEEMRGMAF